MTEIVTQLQTIAEAPPSSAIVEDRNIDTALSIEVPAQIDPAEVTSMPVEEVSTEQKTPEIKKEPTLLGGDLDAKPDEKPIEEKKDVDSPAPEEKDGSQSDEPAPLPIYDKFNASEGFDLDDGLIGDFSKTLGEFERTTKADHAEVQKFGQSLIDRHIAEVKGTIDRYNETLLDRFEQQKTAWRESFENDPEMGGNRKDTTLNAALEFIKTHGGTADQQQEFRQLMHETGVGNHPALIRLLAQAARSSAFTEGKPLPASTPVPTARSKVEKRYGVS